jgi:hypothetical protein
MINHFLEFSPYYIKIKKLVSYSFLVYILALNISFLIKIQVMYFLNKNKDNDLFYYKTCLGLYISFSSINV